MIRIHGWLLAFPFVLSAACVERADSRSSDSAAGDVDLSRRQAAMPAHDDPVVQRADSLLRTGHAWRATALLASRLASPATAAPDARLTGARAAAGWDGWTEVDRLLRDAPWLDSQFGGEGRELLTRSALERGADALPDAQRALASARDEPSRVTRRVFLARAQDRGNQRDSAAASYLAAAAKLPRVADWLRLRAAGVMADSSSRAALFTRVASTPARARIAATDAQARERGADLAGAARAFRRAGDEGSAFRVDAMAARDDAAKAALAQRIVSFLQKSPNSGEARQAIEVLDKLDTLSPRDELIVARAAAAAGSSARAVAAFTKAAAASPLSAIDRMSYASVLSRAGRNADAVRIYATIADDPARAPLAAYLRARTMVQMGDGASARAALRTVAEKFSAAREAGAPALLLLADLQVDDDDLTGAATSLRDLITRFPSASQTPLARFRLGLLQWASNPASSAPTFDALVVAHPRDEEALAARYWAGRAYASSGKKDEASERWRAIIKDAPLSYYAMLSAKRLSVPGWSAPTGADTAAHLASVDSAVQRIVVLQRLGMDVEARFEIDALAARAESAPAEGAAIAQALGTVNEPARALRIALAAMDKGNASRALLRIAYPIVHDDALVEESRRNDLDPALVAGLIRQESSWNPRAVSPATARGLMQLMPSVGASIAASRKYPLWNAALLFDPDVSLELGTAHLASSLRRNTPPERALAAYNAGASRVTRWLARPGTEDAELFTEWIPFTETRDYVRVVLRNAAVYRALYGGALGG
ncbi:MAG: transglycosylase SLT domain-containing protein [Gemmatimonadaceae bacterium]